MAITKKEQNKRYKEKYQEKVRNYALLYKKKNKEKITNWRKLYRQTLKYKYSKYKNGAKSRGYEFNLSIENFGLIINLNCHYCLSEQNIGIDRKDNNIGYTIENSLPCCTICNLLKRDMKYDEFITKCKQIAFNNLI